MEGEQGSFQAEHEIVCDTLTLTEQRSLVFHLLYALDAFDYDISLESVVDNFAYGFNIIIPLDSNVYKTAAAVIQERDQLDALIIPFIENWRFDRLGVPTKLILRNALWELLHTKTDQIVIINEAIELAKCFAEKDAFKFINGVLDKYISPVEDT